MATPKQLAALKKARAARKKNLSKAKPAKRKSNPVKKKAPAKRRAAPKRKVAKSNPVNYGVKVTTKSGDVGYFKNWSGKGPIIDTLASNAKKLNRDGATQIKNALAQMFAKNIKSISVVSIHGKKK